MSHRDDCPTSDRARQQGRAAYENGYGRNPYGEGSERDCEEAAAAWRAGYHQARRQHEEEEEMRRWQERAEEEAYHRQLEEQAMAEEYSRQADSEAAVAHPASVSSKGDSDHG